MRRAWVAIGILGGVLLLLAVARSRRRQDWLPVQASDSRRPAVAASPAVPGSRAPAMPASGLPEARAGAAESVGEADESLVPQGRYVFERNCQVCHGRWGDGRGEMAAGMKPRPRRLTSGIFKFRSTPSGALPTDADLKRTIRRGIPNTSMPTFGHLTARDVEAVIAYLKTLSSRWRQPGNHAAAILLPPEPEWLYRPADRAPHVERGRQLFAANCSGCHGEEGAGTGPAAAALEDSWGDPIPPADLRGPVIKSGPEPKDVFRALTTGLDGTPMPSFGDGLADAERWDLVAYVVELRRRAAPAGESAGDGEGDGAAGKPAE